MVDMNIDPDDLLQRVSRSHARLLKLLDGLDDRRASMDSALPGWTRGHVLKHLADNARAFERQARFALRGRLVDMYDGGQRMRDLSIDQGASSPLAQLREELDHAQQALEEAWSLLTPEDWSRSVRFRNATVLDTALARWREAEIHAVDLAVGYRPRDWSLSFALHALDFLAARAPAGTRLVLRATDHDVDRVLGTAATVEVSGAVRDLAAWMAGRALDGHLRTTARDLPELGPWPPDPAG
ncbi:MULTISPECIES: maleylpyruvate isomerase family mycothiol-dependent enzyme [unclassified Nonomuraea]|uniref:maleylpyruvate isomerase family mycothiol-dependent enzyme n=1 Tax=unclassified Nonomuraea TaxID=2593643 RepID=UPI0033C4D9C6